MVTQRKNIFHFGWGDEERWKGMNSHVYKEEPANINLEYSADKFHNGSKLAKFLSPLSHLLRKGEEKVAFQILTKNVNGKNGKKKLVIHFPAAGQLGWRDRWRTLGQYIHENFPDVTYSCLYAPLYKYRRSKNQDVCRHTYQEVVDSPITFHAFVEEARALIHELGSTYNEIVLTGMSMGAFLISKLVGVPLTTRKDVKIGCVVWMPFFEMTMPDYFRGIVNNNLRGKELPSSCKKFVGDNSKIDDWERVNRLIKYFEQKPLIGLGKEQKNVKFVRVIHSKYDMIIDKSNRDKATVFLQEICKRNGIRFEGNDYNSSHSGSFIWKRMLSKYRKEVVDCFKKI